jgi:endonuclease YncB( thermonuclease family)
MRNLFLVLLLVGLAAPAAAQYKGRVIGGAAAAFDGDTLLVKPESAQPVSVRLWGIDTSEMKGAPWGRQARGALGDFLDWSKRVQCRVVDHDKHMRPVVRCVTTGPGAAGGKDLGIWLLERGWAVADRDVTQAPGADSWLARLDDMAERAARDGRKGRWAEMPK